MKMPRPVSNIQYLTGNNIILLTMGATRMKITTLLALLTLSSIFNTVYATEEDFRSIDDYATFCSEQAQLAGIEDGDEMNQYIKECLESYGITTDDSQ